MGGLVSRSHIQSNQYNDTIQRLVMLGTPNHGSYASHRLAFNINGWFKGKDEFAPAYRKLIPGSDFLHNLNQSDPTEFNNQEDYSYVSVAGVGARSFQKKFHIEIKDQDDGVVPVSSASMLQFSNPLIIKDYFHSRDDDPEDSNGLTNAEGIVLPLLSGNYNSLRNHPKYIGNIGYGDISDIVDRNVPSNLGITILDVNLSSNDYNQIGLRLAYRKGNEIRIFSYSNNP